MRWPWRKRQAEPAQSQPAQSQFPTLLVCDLVERLRLQSKALVDEVQTIAVAQLAAEEQRSTRLDSKAQTLLTTAGLSLTVAFTFGGILLQRPDNLGALGCGAQAVAVVYGIALLLGLASSWFAMHALRIREHRGVDIEDALHADELRDADKEKTAEDAAARYKRYMTPHYWLIYQSNFKVNEDKANTVKRGQYCFFAFLVALMVIGAAMTTAAFKGFGRAAQARASEPPKRPASTPPAPSVPAPPSQLLPAPTRLPGEGQPLRKDEPSVPLTPTRPSRSATSASEGEGPKAPAPPSPSPPQPSSPPPPPTRLPGDGRPYKIQDPTPTPSDLPGRRR